MSLPALLTVLAAALAYFAIRGHWIVWQVQRHAFLALYYCRRTRQNAVVLDEMTMCWPAATILCDLPWHWNMRRYLVHPEHADAMDAWLVGELARADLNVDTYLREMSEDVEVAKAAESANAGAAPAASAPPADPSLN